MKREKKSEWKGALKAMVIVAVLCVGVGIAAAVWDDTKNTGDALTATEWNAMTADQKDAFKKDGSVAMTGDLNISTHKIIGVAPWIHPDNDINYAMMSGGHESADSHITFYGKGDVGFGSISCGVPNATKTGQASVWTVVGCTDTPKLTIFNAAKVDVLEEKTGSAGITIDGCLIKDGYPYIPNHTPSSASEACAAGQICYDSSYTYVCIATNTWERVALSSW